MDASVVKRPLDHDGSPFEAGTVLQDTYRIVRPLAEGGMGQVFVAQHERLPGLFAVKGLQRELSSDPEALSRIRQEAELLSKLRHPNIVQVVDFNFAADGAPYLVMEFLDGPDLARVLRERGGMPASQVARVIRQMASALDAAHSLGIVHRDLKPENVIVVPVTGQDDVVKLIDFGVSKSRWGARITTDSRIIGTPEFMSPEQAQGRRDAIDAQTDQFALAVMTYLLLAGRTPFAGEDPLSVLYQIVNEEPPPLAGFVSWPTTHIDPVLRRGLSKAPEARYPNILSFSQAVEDALASDLGGSEELNVSGPELTKLAPASTQAKVLTGIRTTQIQRRHSRAWPMAALAFAMLCASGVAAYSVGWEQMATRAEVAATAVRERVQQSWSAWRSRAADRFLHRGTESKTVTHAP